MSADNQQGRLNQNLFYYIAGFVDGEGSFHVAIQRNPSVKLTWQIVPEFQISQHENDREVLELIMNTLQCGYIKPNHRHNQNDQTLVYVVRSRQDLKNKVIPFFHKYSLRTSKKENFEKFATIVDLMTKDHHGTREGLKELISLAYSMNKRGKSYRKILLEEIFKDLEPSETICQTI